MNEYFIREKLANLSRRIDTNEIELLKKNNQDLQDFVIWLMGFMDGNISKRGEGKE